MHVRVRGEQPMRMMVVIGIISAAGACGGGNSGPQGAETAPGAPRTSKTAALETGAKVMQAKGPMDQMAIYLDGFHASKDDPMMQMEAHHYCNQVNDDFAQCVMFDGNTKDARLHGVEYIVSEKLYNAMPAEERAFWHPHNYEVLSGELRMPGLPDAAEQETLKTKINSYGKTWHFWKTGVYGQQADPLPFGPPHLAWSFNRDGEVNPELLAERDRRMHLDTAAARRRRQDLVAMAHPQGGVDAIGDRFPQATALPGVTDNGDAAARPVPTFGMKGQEGRPRGR